MPGKLRLWRNHKVVEAGPIVAIEDHHIVVDGLNGRVTVYRPPDFFIRNGRPQQGDYLIIKGGEYTWMPVDKFTDEFREERPALIVP